MVVESVVKVMAAIWNESKYVHHECGEQVVCLWA